MTTFWRPALLGMFLLHLGDDTNLSPASESPSPRQSRNDLLEPARFIQIPGPNPILTPGREGAWDGQIMEAADALSDFGTYYLYYHGNGGEGYQVGVATSSHPPGPIWIVLTVPKKTSPTSPLTSANAGFDTCYVGRLAPKQACPLAEHGCGPYHAVRSPFTAALPCGSPASDLAHPRSSRSCCRNAVWRCGWRPTMGALTNELDRSSWCRRLACQEKCTTSHNRPGYSRARPMSLRSLAGGSLATRPTPSKGWPISRAVRQCF